jgi:hypothetical protein
MRLLKVAPTVIVLSVLLLTPTFAADSVTIPWGDWLSQILGSAAATAGTIAMIIVTYALQFLPATLRSYIDEQRRKQAEQLLERCIAYGINEAKGFVTGKTLDIKVGSEVLAGALQYAVDQGPGWLIGWMGGAERVRDKILSRLALDDGISASEIAENVTLARPISG